MDLTINSDRKNLRFLREESTHSGIIKIADKVRNDMERVFGFLPEIYESDSASNISNPSTDVLCSASVVNDEKIDSMITVIPGIAGESEALRKLEEEGIISLEAIRGRREVYGFFVIPDSRLIVIAGSDKRGTIYGLFHLSGLAGVSPFINWSDVRPKPLDSLTLDEKDSLISKEPSVMYRGFFINDEWPAFGAWANKHFGGMNAEMYDLIFELLLRLKGNYLWPAMWASCFAEDGPGLESAFLADEYGVIMGLSHHEPCLRHGEEYSHLRGKDSIYGDSWDFRSNKEGITRFWIDGLRRNGNLENIITIGMRGERDSKLLGEESTLKSNIELLKDVISTQNRIIREEVNVDLKRVPRMLALYKEVEPYYYGDDKTEGLRYDEELKDVILLLSDDNHGYLRSLPDEKMRKHPGGFGMYYHFDYHGDPVSYEWINSTYLSEVYDEMSMAMDHGVDKLWIVNVGDLAFQELPLSYFLELAYSYDETAKKGTEQFTGDWMKQQFGPALDEKNLKCLSNMFIEFTEHMHRLRPEHMDDKSFPLITAAEEALEWTARLTKTCTELEDKCPEEYKAAFFEMISYNVLAGACLVQLWAYRSYNHELASIGASAANVYGRKMKACLNLDRELRDKLHSLNDGKWDGLALAEHIGFRHWNSEERHNPVIENVIPVESGSLVAAVVDDRTGHLSSTEGREWTGKRLRLSEVVSQGEAYYGDILVAMTGDGETVFEVETKGPALAEVCHGRVSDEAPLHRVRVDLEKGESMSEKSEVMIKYPSGKIYIDIDSYQEYHDRKIVIEVARPCDNEVSFNAELLGAGGEYEIIFESVPKNPVIYGSSPFFTYKVGDGEERRINVFPEGYESGISKEWAEGVMTHVRRISGGECRLSHGMNRIEYKNSFEENKLLRVILIRKET